ncbi:hypothetical protein AWM75_05635 [Aerococcus urinaehominis]|uniref:Fumarylacetoacetase-like C-terminal domain-containing protein n=1 Tax=Aerococcus urinaehominis TaxID=128944 RepID=A0A0X8FLG9_9LACT|nr:fumarylacetoacetate hydrolase family protein [Aerococcus urinaehominis]AMB99508.1 hypothetical protein AWM75_05635 [Aerococcus urinaehominis]SDM26004.1 2-keto-4-pentenoate hydratase/2-oxohepta-3-ene-1,7-dioic acid hydratase (catechol pathway) [Aerococcus urinaehominis]
MKLFNYVTDNGKKLAVVIGEASYDLDFLGETFNYAVPSDIKSYLEHPSHYQLADLIRVAEREPVIQADQLDTHNISFAPIIENPSKIICVGLNYADHAAEVNMAVPEAPEIFSKSNNAITGHQQTIYVPKTVSQLDYEAELVIVIGKAGHNISLDQADQHIFGYTIGNDLSARDLQFKTSQWYLGKTLDGFAPIGPYLITRDQFNLANSRIGLKRNGKIVQDASTADLIRKPQELVAYLSQYMQLRPGDLIFTGTPHGVVSGLKPDQQEWVGHGEELTVFIEGIGQLTNIIKFT